MSQSWLILSGKGGVGKTMLTASLGMALAKRKLKCCCVDADLGLRDLDLLLGMENSVVFDMLDVARKDCKLKYALLQHHQLEDLSLLLSGTKGRIYIRADIKPVCLPAACDSRNLTELGIGSGFQALNAHFHLPQQLWGQSPLLPQ